MSVITIVVPDFLYAQLDRNEQLIEILESLEGTVDVVPQSKVSIDDE